MPYKKLYQNIFKEQLDDIGSKEALTSITRSFPYFSAAHFFLLKQTDELSIDHKMIAAKTALHFDNLFLLNLQLNKQEKEIIATQVLEAVEEIKEEEKTELVKKEISEEKTEISEIEQQPKAVVATEDTEILFEPLHTTDYFASQGIKISDEVQPNDKLGKQLKSFTDWLKTMKKVHDSKLPQGSDQMDASVNKLAEKSNKEAEVLTEAMAEAFAQQGKHEKAKDIYLKLSLLNPSKNAYFAAKLEQFK